jgi:hypothetical protein
MSSIVDGVLGGGDAASSAAGAQVDASQAAINEMQRQFDQTQQNIKPLVKALKPTLQTEMALLGLKGQDKQQAAFDAFMMSPGQTFLRDQGEQAILRNASATGALGSGNVLKELQTFGQGTASQALSEQLNRLASLRGGSQTAVTNLGSIGASTSASIADSLMAQGQAQASGVLGEQQANAGLAESVIGLGSAFFSDRKLKKNVKKLGELASGLAWYAWEWNEKGRQLTGLISGEGVMADEALAKFPDAIDSTGEYMKVDYARIS